VQLAHVWSHVQHQIACTACGQRVASLVSGHWVYTSLITPRSCLPSEHVVTVCPAMLAPATCPCRLCLDIDNAGDCKVAEQTRPKPSVDWATWKEQGEPVQCT
jgi:hypothetical protein